MSEKEFYLYIDGQNVKVSEEVYRVYKSAEEKERYFMKRLKKGRFITSADGKEAAYIPGREKSYEKLLDEGWEFANSGVSVEDMVVRACLMKELEAAIHTLPDEERMLIEELFYLDRTEREVSANYHVTQAAVHKRKKKVLKKLKKLL